MPSIQITQHTRADGSVVMAADVTDLAVAFDEQIDGRQIRYFDFGAGAPPDAADVVAAQLRAELPVPASAPATTTTVDL